MDKYIVNRQALIEALETFEPVSHIITDFYSGYPFLEKDGRCDSAVRLTEVGPNSYQLSWDHAAENAKPNIERAMQRLVSLCNQISGQQAADPLAESSGQSNRPLDQRV